MKLAYRQYFLAHNGTPVTRAVRRVLRQLIRLRSRKILFTIIDTLFNLTRDPLAGGK